MSKPKFWNKHLLSYLKSGDWLILMLSVMAIVVVFKVFWHVEPATKLRIRSGEKIYAILSLDQSRVLEVPGELGSSRIVIANGQVRFEQSPCTNQYCVHQGWLKHGGEVAICLPNRVSLELLGGQKNYDSLNY